MTTHERWERLRNKIMTFTLIGFLIYVIGVFATVRLSPEGYRLLLRSLPVLLGFAISFGFAIIVHELGHMLMCRKVGVRVNNFSVGWGKRDLWKKKIGDTTYHITTLFFIGGSCDPDNSQFEAASSGKRIMVFLAGVFCNLLTAIFSMFISALLKGSSIVNALITAVSSVPMVLGMIKDTIFSPEYLSSILSHGSEMEAYKGLIMECATASGLTQTFITVAAFSMVLNYLVLLFNLLPLPGLDGWQALTECVQIVLKKHGKKPIPFAVLNKINSIGCSIFFIVNLLLMAWMFI